MRSSPSDPIEAARSRRLAPFLARPFAHRGLHGRGASENSRAAFEAAIASGMGIELDVRASRDGEAFVFHDEELARLTGEAGAFGARDAAALRQLRLSACGESLFSLSDALALVAGRTPLLIEAKAPERHVSQLCLAVHRALEGYGGAAAVMSFNPLVGAWFARHAPRRPRGLVVTEEGKGALKVWIERRLGVLRAQPDFLAYDIRSLPSRFAAAQRRRGLPILTWTVRAAAEQERAALHADQIITERE